MNNKGFTLIELLVVIAIIGITSTLGVVTFNSYRSADSHMILDRVSSTLDIAKAVTQSSAGDVQLKIYVDTPNKMYMADIVVNTDGVESVYETYKIGKTEYKISCNSTTDPTTFTEITADSPKIITFDRSTGEYNSDNYSPILRVNGREVGELHLVKETGRYYQEQ